MIRRYCQIRVEGRGDFTLVALSLSSSTGCTWLLRELLRPIHPGYLSQTASEAATLVTMVGLGPCVSGYQVCIAFITTGRSPQHSPTRNRQCEAAFVAKASSSSEPCRAEGRSFAQRISSAFQKNGRSLGVVAEGHHRCIESNKTQNHKKQKKQQNYKKRPCCLLFAVNLCSWTNMKLIMSPRKGRTNVRIILPRGDN